MVPFAGRGYGFSRGRDVSIFSDSLDNLCRAGACEDGINTRGDANMQQVTSTTNARRGTPPPADRRARVRA
ncbi:hypothetical protein BURMUCF2_A1747 [Burkholderia multivorans CF2]|nr:hypothetical protein BURMUCF2_A1747 [Burkholderia multivorans CF2]